MHSDSCRERGSVMVWALIFVIVTAGMIISHSAYMASHRQTMDVQLKRKPLAATLARAALTDGLSWFQAQATQPVGDFTPRKDTTTTPPILDTEDPTLGLVREFEIRGDLWGRYEIQRQDAMDASMQNGMATPGSVWELAARGYVFRAIDPSVPFDQAPNKIVSTARVETSIRSVPLNLPAMAAVGADNVLQVSVGPGGKIAGGSSVAGLAGPSLFPLPLLSPLLSLLISGTPSLLLAPVYDSSPINVFKMSLPMLRDFSDLAVAPGSKLWLGSRQLSQYAVVFHDGDLTLAAADKLVGSMLLVVNGNFTVQPETDSVVSGVIYVTGNTDIRGPFVLRGTLIGKGSIHLQGNGAGKDAVIQHDAASVQQLLQSLGRYRANRVIRNTDDEQAVGGANVPPTVGTGGSIGKGVQIGSNVTIGNSVLIGDLCVIDDDASIGDNSNLALRTRVGKQGQVGTGVQVGTNVMIGALAVIGNGATIGDDVTIGVGAKITTGATVPAGTTVRGGTVF